MLKNHRGFAFERNIDLSACVFESLSGFLYVYMFTIHTSVFLTCCLYMWLPAQMSDESRFGARSRTISCGGLQCEQASQDMFLGM